MEPYIGQIVVYAGSQVPRPRYWAASEEQLLPISEHSLLFVLFGAEYGGDGRTTFAIPDMREKDKLLKKAAGLKESSPHLFHMIALDGTFPRLANP